MHSAVAVLTVVNLSEIAYVLDLGPHIKLALEKYQIRFIHISVKKSDLSHKMIRCGCVQLKFKHSLKTMCLSNVVLSCLTLLVFKFPEMAEQLNLPS